MRIMRVMMAVFLVLVLAGLVSAQTVEDLRQELHRVQENMQRQQEKMQELERKLQDMEQQQKQRTETLGATRSGVREARSVRLSRAFYNVVTEPGSSSN